MYEKSLFNQAFADVIRTARVLQRRTVIEIAEQSGISKPTLMRIEKGSRDINVTQLTQLAPVLGVTPEVLMRRAVDRAAELEEETGANDTTTSDLPTNVRHIGDKRSGRSGETPTSPATQTGTELDRRYRDGEGDIAATKDPEMDTDQT